MPSTSSDPELLVLIDRPAWETHGLYQREISCIGGIGFVNLPVDRATSFRTVEFTHYTVPNTAKHMECCRRGLEFGIVVVTIRGPCCSSSAGLRYYAIRCEVI